MKQYYIYEITNNINNKKYIGKHYGEINDSYLGSGILIKEAIKKYGSNNFTKKILYVSQNEQENCEKEKQNLREKSLNYWTDEKRKQRSIQYSGQGNPMYGKKKSLESIKKQVEHTDYSFTQTEEYRKKMSVATSGNKNGNYGNIGEKAKNGKKVIMKDEYGNIIKEFNTVRLALEYLQIKGHSSLDEAIAKKRLYKGYYWEKQ